MLSLKRLAMNVVIGLGAALLLVVVAIRLLENRLIFFPPRYPEGFEPPGSYGLKSEEVWITASDGVKINAWFFPNSSSAKVLLCFHGNAENIGYALPRMKTLSRLGTNLLAVDYRGYGRSEGSPNEPGVYRDAEAAYRYLTVARGFSPQNIIIYGQSLGGAVATDLALKRECGGLVVESSFTSGRDMARRMFLIPLLEYVPKSRFDSISKIAQVRAPVLIIHGSQDELIPLSMGERLYQAAPEPKGFLRVEGAGHNDVFLVGGEKYVEALKDIVGSQAAR